MLCTTCIFLLYFNINITNLKFLYICWICLPLLTLWIIRSSCPPSHHWASQGFHFAGLTPISPTSLSGWPGEGGIQSTSTGHWGSSGISFWTPPFLQIHYITGSHHIGTWFLLPLLCWWHTALSLISTRWSNGSCTGLRLPGGHLGMDERTSPTAQPGKDWAPCLPCHSNSTAWFYHPARFINNYPIRNLGVIFDDQLTFKDHIAKTTQSCRFAQHQKDQALPYTACCTTSCHF